MRNLRFSFISLALTLGTGAAFAADLNLGGSYTQNIYMDGSVVADGGYGGGPIAVSYLDGTQLAWVYCVDMIDVVYVPADYNNTTVTHDGTVTATTYPGLAVTTGVVNNVGAIAWLLNTYAGTATTTTQQAALQAAIWHEVYGNAEYLDASNNSAAVVAQYNADLAALGSNTDSPADLDWFTPKISGSSGTTYQALVGPGPGFGNNIPGVPEPASIILLATVLLGVVRLLKQKLAVGRQS